MSDRPDSGQGDAQTAQGEAYAALAQSGRAFVDAVVRTRVDPIEAREVAAHLDELTARLAADGLEDALGMRPGPDGVQRGPANPADGGRNPIAPPVVIEKDRDALMSTASAVLGAGYEGPPGCVHGGIIALVLDQVLGTIPALVGRPGMTATLSMTYRRPTPLGRIGARAWVDRQDGWKTFVRGELTDAHGRVTVESEGLFIVPRAFRTEPGLPWESASIVPREVPPSDVSEYPA